VIFSEAHGHFHYVGWQEVDVYHLNDDGTVGALAQLRQFDQSTRVLSRT